MTKIIFNLTRIIIQAPGRSYFWNMVEIRLHTYGKYALPDLMQRVNDDYYIILARLSWQAAEYAETMETAEQSGDGKLFFQLNRTWAVALGEYIKHRDEIFLPYLLELAEKEGTGHNCSQCSGKCDMQHTARIIEFTHTLEQARQQYTVYSERLRTLPGTAYTTQFEAMVTTMAFLAEYAHQLWRIESDCVLPKIKTAQRNINAHS